MVLLNMKIVMASLILSAWLTLVPRSGAIWNTDVLATVAISKSLCSDFMNMNIVASASDQNRSTMEEELIFFYYYILMKLFLFSLAIAALKVDQCKCQLCFDLTWFYFCFGSNVRYFVWDP